MKIGLQPNRFDWSGGPERFGRPLVDIARASEGAGFGCIGVGEDGEKADELIRHLRWLSGMGIQT